MLPAFFSHTYLTYLSPAAVILYRCTRVSVVKLVRIMCFEYNLTWNKRYSQWRKWSNNLSAFYAQLVVLTYCRRRVGATCVTGRY